MIPDKLPEKPPQRIRQYSRPGGKTPGGFLLIAVQSISCLTAIVFFITLRSLGGETYSDMKVYVQNLLNDNVLGAAIAMLWEDNFTKESGVQTDITDTTTIDNQGSHETIKTNEMETTSHTQATETTVAKAMGGGETVENGISIAVMPPNARDELLILPKKAEKPTESGEISSLYGFRKDPTDETKTEFHTGLDIAADFGTPIKSLYCGNILEVSEDNSYGKYVKISCANGVEILYAHCSEILVKKGDAVEAGERVAKMGSSGKATGSHLHIEVQMDDIKYNPSGIVADMY